MKFYQCLPFHIFWYNNIERLENIFKANTLMMRSFVFPAKISEEEKNESCRELFKKYGIYADGDTSASYAALLKRFYDTASGDGAAVLVCRDAPCLDNAFIKHNIGEEAEVPEQIKRAFSPSLINRSAISKDGFEDLISILNSVNLRLLF